MRNSKVEIGAAYTLFKQHPELKPTPRSLDEIDTSKKPILISTENKEKNSLLDNVLSKVKKFLSL